MSTRHIAYVCADPGIPVFGTKGASIHVQSVVRAALKAGHRVTLLATRFGGECPRGLEGAVCVQLPELPQGDPEKRARAALDARPQMSALLDAHAPYDLVYERYSLWSDVGMRWARAHGIPGVLEVNAPLIEEQRTHRGLVLEDEAMAVAGSAFSQASALVGVSPGVAAYLRTWPGTEGRVHVVANGVDPEAHAAGAAARLARGADAALTAPTAQDAASTPASAPGQATPAGQAAASAAPSQSAGPVVGFLGTLKPWHGLPLLVDAFARLNRLHPGTRLLVVGDGPERATMEAALQAQGLLSQCEFTGAVQAHEVPALLARMDIATAPYPQQENFYFSPLKIYEYLASGLPVVTTRVGHLDTVVLDGVDGVLVEPGDPDAFAAAMARLLQDPALRLKMGQAGRARIQARHSWDAVTAHLLGIADASRATL